MKESEQEASEQEKCFKFFSSKLENIEKKTIAKYSFEKQGRWKKTSKITVMQKIQIVCNFFSAGRTKEKTIFTNIRRKKPP